jgi:c-di-GMP-binding flagellar brake protein YcgR
VFFSDADITLKSGAKISARTFDIAPGGIALLLPRGLTMGEACVITVTLSKDGREEPVTIVAKVLYCILAELDRFKAGFQFLEVEPTGAKLIDELFAGTA